MHVATPVPEEGSSHLSAKTERSRKTAAKAASFFLEAVAASLPASESPLLSSSFPSPVKVEEKELLTGGRDSLSSSCSFFLHWKCLLEEEEKEEGLDGLAMIKDKGGCD